MAQALWLLARIPAKYAAGESPERGLLECPLASTRLRTAVAAVEWRERGNENIFRIPSAIQDTREPSLPGAGICIVPKFYADAPLEPWLGAVRAAKRGQWRLVIDISDNPFEKERPVPEFYAEALRICDAVVVNSEAMAELIAPHVPHRPLVIADAILGSRHYPEFAAGSRLELLWFGHPTNLSYLHTWVNALGRFAMRRTCRLTVVTVAGAGAEALARDIQSRFAPAFEARFIPWSLESLQAALGECNLVLIPSDPSDPRKQGASANRIAETLNAGRFPVASPLPSYLHFAQAAWLGNDIIAGIEWALANPGKVVARIRRGQIIIAENFAAERIGRQWRELFENIVASRAS